MKKRLLATLLTGVLALTVITGCQESKEDSGKSSSKTIKIAASETPHSEILEKAKDIIKEQGYDLQVTVFR